MTTPKIKNFAIFVLDAFLLISGLLMMKDPAQYLVAIGTIVFLGIFFAVIRLGVICSTKRRKHSFVSCMLNFIYKIRRDMIKEKRMITIGSWKESRFIIGFIIPILSAIGATLLLVRVSETSLDMFLAGVTPHFNEVLLLVLLSAFVRPLFQYIETRLLIDSINTLLRTLATKFTLLFIYGFTFFAPIMWLVLLYFIYILSYSRTCVENQKPPLIH